MKEEEDMDDVNDNKKDDNKLDKDHAEDKVNTEGNEDCKGGHLDKEDNENKVDKEDKEKEKRGR